MGQEFSLYQYDVYFFDFDGLLVDTEPVHYRSFCQACEEFGVPIISDFLTYYRYAVQGSWRLQQYVLESSSCSGEQYLALRRRKQAIYLDMVHQNPPDLLPGVEDFLHTVHQHGKRMVVVTNATQNEVAHMYGTWPCLRDIQDWVCREHYRNPKPASDPYVVAWERYVQQGDRVVGFEDTYQGMCALQGIRSDIVEVNLYMSSASHLQDLGDRRVFYYQSFEEILSLGKSRNS